MCVWHRCFRKSEVTVVVDVTDWGYRVGEIEVMVSSTEEVPAAVDKIEQIAKKMSEWGTKLFSLFFFFFLPKIRFCC